ncbi:MAG: hypothetical protein ABSC93_08475 [Bryobacteraceae bacterium]
MQLTSFSRAGMLALFALSTLFTGPARAKDGRDFAGYYSLTDAAEKGGAVELTLALQLFNYSGADLKQAVVTVRSSPSPGVLGSFAPIKVWRSGSDVVIRQQMTVPRDVFERWSPRNQPVVFIGYSDENGQAFERPAQLSRRPMIPEARPAAE